WIVGSNSHGCWLGTYEADKQRVVERLVCPGMVVWDVGANVGFYSLGFSRLVGLSGRVYAFEPSANNAANLREHVTLNGLENVILVQVAFSNDSGIAGFDVTDSTATGHLSRTEQSYLIPTLTGDEFLSQVLDARPDFVKIDIEGAESDFLDGSRNLLRNSGPPILLALHGE